MEIKRHNEDIIELTSLQFFLVIIRLIKAKPLFRPRNIYPAREGINTINFSKALFEKAKLMIVFYFKRYFMVIYIFL